MFRASDCVLTDVHHLLGRSANPVEYMVGQISERLGEKSALALVRSLPRGNGGLGDAALPICLASRGLISGQPAAKTAASEVRPTGPAHRERPLGIDPRR